MRDYFKCGFCGDTFHKTEINWTASEPFAPQVFCHDCAEERDYEIGEALYGREHMDEIREDLG